MSTKDNASTPQEEESSKPSLSENTEKTPDSSVPQLDPESDAMPENERKASGSPGPTNATPDGENTSQPAAPTNPASGDWQAIWSPQHNAYYFYNSRSNETTWTNPLAVDPTVPDVAITTQPGASSSSQYDAQSAAISQGIDPALAYLDPSLAAGPSNPAAFTYQAKFNARTGAFARPDARDPDHVSEYERMKRMSQFYFDVNQWETEVAQRQAEEEEIGKKRKKPTKKDLELFKERKRQKKIAKTAWLRT